jgi:hypothetical protein
VCFLYQQQLLKRCFYTACSPVILFLTKVTRVLVNDVPVNFVRKPHELLSDVQDKNTKNWQNHEYELEIDTSSVADTNPQPFSVTIEYQILFPTMGVEFFGPHINPPKYPQLCIKSVSSQARGWLPCLDGLNDKCTFDLQIAIPSCVYNSVLMDQHDYFENLPMIVVCSGDLKGRYQHPISNDKIFYSYKISSPIAASSIVIAVGPFESKKFSYFKPIVKSENADPDEMVPEILQNISPSRVEVFYISRFKDAIHPTCYYLPQVSIILIIRL